MTMGHHEPIQAVELMDLKPEFSVLHTLISGCLAAAAIAQLCLTSAIFDFIVVNKMYYTLPEQRILIDADASYWFYAAASSALFISSSHFVVARTSIFMRTWLERHSILVWVAHNACLILACVLSVFCVVVSVSSTIELERFAFDSVPAAFQLASHWYFVRMRASAAIHAATAALAAALFILSYFGIATKDRRRVSLASAPFRALHDHQQQQQEEAKAPLVASNCGSTKQSPVPTQSLQENAF